MKNRFFRAFALALALMLCAVALAEVRTTASINMRSGPGKDYEIVTSFSADKLLTYLGETSVDERGIAWYKVSGGDKTGWVSSMYSKLENEDDQPAATAAPTAEDAAAQPTEAPATQPQAGLPALNAGGLFADSLNPAKPEPTQAPVEEPAQEPAPAPAGEPAQEPLLPALQATVELSTYYRDNLVDAANAIGLISYRQVESEAPYQYYDDALILAGNQNVENIVVYGEGYEVYGVHVGMSVNAAMACLNAAGLDYAGNNTFEHRAAADSGFFADENGHDSCINLWVNDEDIVTEIDWSTYTG